MRNFRSAADFSIVPATLIIDAIFRGHLYLKLLSQLIKRLAAADLSVYVLKLAEKLNNASFKMQPEESWKLLRSLVAISAGNKYSPDRSLPLLYDENKVPVSTHERKLQVFFDHFAKLEMAESVSVDQLVSRCHKVGTNPIDYVPTLKNIMSPFEFGSKIARCSTGHEAPGFGPD